MCFNIRRRLAYIFFCMALMSVFCLGLVACWIRYHLLGVSRAEKEAAAELLPGEGRCLELFVELGWVQEWQEVTETGSASAVVMRTVQYFPPGEAKPLEGAL